MKILSKKIKIEDFCLNKGLNKKIKKNKNWKKIWTKVWTGEKFRTKIIF